MKPLILRFYFLKEGKNHNGSYQCKCHGVLDMHNEAPYGPTTRPISYFYISHSLLLPETGAKFGLHGIRIDCVCDLTVQLLLQKPV